MSDAAVQLCNAFGVPLCTLSSDTALTLCQETSGRPQSLLMKTSLWVPTRSHRDEPQNGVEGQPCGVLIRASGFHIIFFWESKPATE